MSDQVPKPSRHHVWRISVRTLSKSWDDSIFSESAQAGFWSALSLPPLLLGMLGSLAYIAPLFGPDTLPAIEHQLIIDGEQLLLPQRGQRDHRADHPRHRQQRPRRGGVVRLRDLAVGRLVGHLGVRRLGGRGARPDAAAPPRAAAVLRAGPLRGDAGRRGHDGAAGRGRPAQDRRAHPGQLGQRAAVRLLPGAGSRPDGGRHGPVPGVAAASRCRRIGWSSARSWRRRSSWSPRWACGST